MQKFYPFHMQIEIEPMKKEGVMVRDDKGLLEIGRVIAVGEGVDFFKVGDIAHFESFGHLKTVGYEGKEHHVVMVNEHVIRGKHA